MVWFAKTVIALIHLPALAMLTALKMNGATPTLIHQDVFQTNSEGEFVTINA